ncbi:uncharacterized protein LOC112504018 [Rhizophagus clarus]|uniref:Uncharacterized protein LOC112504018 n=1 Tax=Rhizophagus clarus TaxID=94130 RepID=A0A8H3KZY3_9GLOM|nr:uncharacterized protein LOC112504018 [Rhizophagus clarus]
MAEEDKEKTAFICSQGLFEYNVMPFGLKTAPVTFQRLMDKILNDYIGKFVTKCKFGGKNIEFLGHEIGKDGLKANEKKIETIRDISIPRNITEKQQEAFKSLKKRLMEKLILEYPDFEKEFILITDTLGEGLGFILAQKNKDKDNI